MTLDELRQKVIYQNTIDVWIKLCEEKSMDWNVAENYKKFIDYLLTSNINMKKFPLCVSDGDSKLESTRQKVKFAEGLSEENNPLSTTYTIRLNDSTIEIIRKFN
ncbi:MAG TPA: hypothetical protein VMW55_03455 [Nitrosopumilaceae archaeon]|jgi:hypothetical protein|nr:hypothetical protein [Nitrosopumilaceae archaeon]